LAQNIFATTALNLSQWGLVLIVSSSGFVVLEVLKLFKRCCPKLAPFIPS